MQKTVHILVQLFKPQGRTSREVDGRFGTLDASGDLVRVNRR